MEKYKFTNGQANLLIAIFKHLRQYSEQAKANGTSVADELNNATTQDFDMYAILLDDALANCLTNHEHELIARRYGLQPYTKCFTREEVARNFNVTYERIRQCEARSIQKIRRFMTELNDEETDKVICDLQPDVQKTANECNTRIHRRKLYFRESIRPSLDSRPQRHQQT